MVIGSEEHQDEYTYTGAQSATNTLALVYNPTTQSFSLNRIDSEFRFNLRSTPTNKDAASLATKYPHIDSGSPASGQENDDLFGAGNEDQHPKDAEPDPSNPYDYRHFLNHHHKPSPGTPAVSSPVPHLNGNTLKSNTTSRQAGLTPVPRQSKPRPPKPKPRQRDRPQYLSPSPAQREEADADNEESDTNELIIDMGDSAKDMRGRHRSALGVLNEGGRSNGPISLRSAASSMSPSVRGFSDGEASRNGRDVDIEEIDLGSPKIDLKDPVPAKEEEVVTNGNGWDDEDDMAAELENAMMQDEAEEQAKPAVVNESSSESEEE